MFVIIRQDFCQTCFIYSRVHSSVHNISFAFISATTYHSNLLFWQTLYICMPWLKIRFLTEATSTSCLTALFIFWLYAYLGGGAGLSFTEVCSQFFFFIAVLIDRMCQKHLIYSSKFRLRRVILILKKKLFVWTSFLQSCSHPLHNYLHHDFYFVYDYWKIF